MRLACRVTQDGPAFRHRRCEEHILRRGHRRLVEDDISASQTIRRDRETVARIERCTELAEREEVTVDTTSPDDVAARLAEARALATREERRREYERRPDLLCQRRGQLVVLQLFRRDAHRVRVEVLDLRAERARALEHVAHIEDARHFAQRVRIVGEQRGGDARERLVDRKSTRLNSSPEWISY